MNERISFILIAQANCLLKGRPIFEYLATFGDRMKLEHRVKVIEEGLIIVFVYVRALE